MSITVIALHQVPPARYHVLAQRLEAQFALPANRVKLR